jgi:predicted nuclease of predicted toxin-antitoxin system
MKLLLDENLSRRLLPFLLEAYPDSGQVVLLGLQHATDLEIWEHAAAHDYILLTKDADFYDLSLTRGSPPQVIWLRTGNAGNAYVLQLLLDYRSEIQAAFESGIACVELGR